MIKHFVPYYVFAEHIDGLEVYPLGISAEMKNKGFDFNKPIMRYEDAQRGGFLYMQKEEVK